MSPTATAADGSSLKDAPAPVEIDPTDPTIRWRYACPNGHITIEPTNGGLWCQSCSKDVTIEDPHHHEILDKRSGESIPWSRVRYR